MQQQLPKPLSQHQLAAFPVERCDRRNTAANQQQLDTARGCAFANMQAGFLHTAYWTLQQVSGTSVFCASDLNAYDPPLRGGW